MKKPMMFSYAAVRMTLLFLITLFFKTGLAQQQSNGNLMTLLTVGGAVEHPLQLRNGDGFPSSELAVISITSFNGILKKQFSARGMLLKTVLDSASIQGKNSKQKGQYYILLTAQDGYRVIFSWSELYNSPIGDSVYLLHDADSTIQTRDGPWMLVSLQDKITGPRYVKWLKKIEVKRD